MMPGYAPTRRELLAAGAWAGGVFLATSLLACVPLSETAVAPDVTATRAKPTDTPERAPTSTVAPKHTPEPTDTSPASPTLTVAPTHTSEPTPIATEEITRVTMTIVYDNNLYDDRLKTAWGFSCLVEWGNLTLLFDTGGDSPTLLSNMATLGLDPAEIDVVVLSHIHGDHVGGLSGILTINEGTTVYVPQSFPAGFKRQVRDKAQLVEVHEPVEIAEGIHITGEMGTSIREQSLVLVTGRGVVVITGCAHPGIVPIVARAKELGGQEVCLAMGGFHLVNSSQATIKGVIADLQELGVQNVAPCHCSGDLARRLFKEAYGDHCGLVGVGWRLEV